MIKTSKIHKYSFWQWEDGQAYPADPRDVAQCMVCNQWYLKKDILESRNICSVGCKLKLTDRSLYMGRYFEFKDKESSKFWEITVAGKKVTIHYGKIGTAGKNTVKELATPAEANTHAEKVIGEKMKKGYKEKKK